MTRKDFVSGTRNPVPEKQANENSWSLKPNSRNPAASQYKQNCKEVNYSRPRGKWKWNQRPVQDQSDYVRNQTGRTCSDPQGSTPTPISPRIETAPPPMAMERI